MVAQALTKSNRVRDVTVLALRNMNLEICAGGLLVIPGPSGIGKST